MDITKELPTVISFCSGYGGIERGLDLAGVEHRVLCYVEIEAFVIANLVAKMESGFLAPAPVYTDLKTFPAHLFRDCVDIITGGYPCQPFSTAGKRQGKEDPRHLWPYIRKHINAIRPVRCLFENVEGHISMGLSSVVSDLEEDGYQTAWGIFSAAEVGAPHQRKRVFVMADSGDDRPQSKRIPRRSKAGDHTIGGNGSCLADADSSGQQQGDQETTGRPSEQLDLTGVQSRKVPDTDIEGLEGRLSNGVTDPQGREKSGERSSSECSDWGSWFGTGAWPPEPNVGRVVDGSSHRVDRLRLLGNGVVPQTAATAWLTLAKEFTDEDV